MQLMKITRTAKALLMCPLGRGSEAENVSWMTAPNTKTIVYVNTASLSLATQLSPGSPEVTWVIIDEIL